MVIDIMTWLGEQCTAIAALEAKAAAQISAGDSTAYRATMQEKATLLAGLAMRAEPALASCPEEKRNAIRSQLNNFSASAQNALSIGSVFYMSALLYPDEHKAGQPNNLELYRDTLAKTL
jgi:hypothetical protein